MNKYYLVFIIISFIGFQSCNEDDDVDDVFSPTPYKLEIPLNFPTEVNIPADNPMTVEGVKLGRYLYYDDRMSGKADQGMGMSCSSCHQQQFSFENGVGKAIGTIGQSTHHTMLPHINLAWNPGTFGWNGGVKSIEEDVYLVIPDPTEFASNWEDVIAAISAVPEYPAMFKAAFGTPEITKERIAKAIAQFMRSMVSANSKFDRFMRGEENLTTSEFKGYQLFITEQGADCFHCHGGAGNPLWTTHGFYNNAKDTVFDLAFDRYSVTQNPKDKGAYKATTLRNIEFTGPYMHDGRFQTLEQVIDFYSEGLVYSEYAHPLMEKLIPPFSYGAQLLPSEKADLKAFLLTLSDTSYLTNPNYSSPFNKK